MGGMKDQLGDNLFTYSDRLAEARAARDRGMALSADNAERANTDWSRRAYGFLVEFAACHLLFISEDVSGASKEQGFPQPPTDRAWGAVYRKAIKTGIIVQHGTGRSARRHASLCPQWKSLVYAGRAP